MRKTILASTAAIGLAALSVTALNAQGAPEAEMDTSAITSGSYSTDPAHTLVGWRLDHLGFNDYFGIYGDITGTLELDTENLANSSVDVTIPLATPTVASAGLRDHLLRDGADGAAPDFFGSDPAPARFVSTAVHQTGDTTAHIMGDLTFNGVTKPVTIQAELAGMGTNMMSQKETVGFHGTTTINRSEWNLGWGIPFGLGDEVELDITVAFEKN
ncbi:YceI family protein [Aurantiacibacter sp. MUD11]|uniref:YceI family protein n=1 Tax=Aurantiacibacter sp. MUD11 TaxID=3003265 RepID=UPI0022AAB5EE|nr:YceI family protein [Aurantiacibacter sp. MUD11]WAT18252.1 YceI family protein [Aurantiacibacter sp. MUD11]